MLVQSARRARTEGAIRCVHERARVLHYGSTVTSNALAADLYGFVAVAYGLSVRTLWRQGWPERRQPAVRGQVDIRVAPAPGTVTARTRRAS